MSDQDKASLAQQAVPEPVTLADVLDALNVFNRPKPSEDDGPWEAEHFIRVDYLPAFINNIAAAWYSAAPAAPQDSQSPAEAHGDLTDEQILRAISPELWLHIEGERRAQALKDARAAIAADRDARSHVQPNSEAQAAPQAEQQSAEISARIDALMPLPDFLPHQGISTGEAPAMYYSRGVVREAIRAAMAAQQAERKPLTDEQVVAEFSKLGGVGDAYLDWFEAGVEFAERAHGIGHHVPGQGSQP